MNSITQNMINEASKEHAIDQLGQNQFKKNKVAADAIMSDFKAGVKFIIELLETNEDDVVNLSDYGSEP